MESKYGKIVSINNVTFKDGYNRLILVDKSTRKAYFIEEVDETAFRILDSRVTLAIVAFIFVSSTWNMVAALIISVLVLLAFQFYQSKFFIPQLREAKDFPLPEDFGKVDHFAKRDSKTLAVMLVFFLILSVLMFLSVKKMTDNFTNFSFSEVKMTVSVLGSTGIGLLCLYTAIASAVALIKKKK